MDSRSYPARDHGAAQRLLDALSRVLASSLCDGLSATCDVHIGDRTGREFARCRISARGLDAWEILVGQEPAACQSSPVAGEVEMGIDGLNSSDEVKHSG